MNRVSRALLTLLSIAILMRSKQSLVMGVLPSTAPVALDMVTGFEGNMLFRDFWYVGSKLYRLTQVKMWKNERDTSGFEVTFEVPPRFNFTGPGYEPITKVFGDKDQDSEVETITIDDDILEVAVCVDPGESDSRPAIDHDFDSFIFRDARGVDHRIGPRLGCETEAWTWFTLPSQLIGFSTREGFFQGAQATGRFNIRSIALVVD